MSIPNLDTIRKQFMQGEYERACEELFKLIRKNREQLFLDYYLFDNDFVQSTFNTYRHENHAVIRTPFQIFSIIKELKLRGTSTEVKILTDLVKKVKRRGVSLLLADDLSDKKKLFQEISHELNAWTASGCSDKKKNFSCLLGDWRRFIPGNLSRRLDYYLWGLSDSV